MFRKSNRGFTMVEILTTIGIVAVLAGVATTNYFNVQAKQSVDSTANELLGNLRDAQQRAISQENQAAWGIYINAVSGGRDYYELFSGNSRAAGTVAYRITLPSDVQFSVPGQGSTLEINFSKSTGLPTNDYSVSINSSKNTSLTRSFSLNTASGLINYSAAAAAGPSISSITPSSANNGGSVSITNVAGTGFQQGLTLQLSRYGESPVNCSVSYINSTTLTGSCDLANKIVGDWNVLVTNPDTQYATLTNGFSITGGSVPGAPYITAATMGNQQIQLTWDAPTSNGGSAITNYEIYRSTTSGQETLLIEVGNVLTYTNTSLTNGTTYYYKVAAKNSYGIGSQSDELSGLAATTSSAPQSLSATPDNSQIQLNWSAPASNGGSSITNYEIYRGPSSGDESLLTEIGNVLTYTNTGLANGTTYYYKVAAKNAAGIGTQSSEVNAVPGATPSSPQNLYATAGVNQIQLNWSAPSSNGGSAITNYEIYRSTTSGQETLLIEVGNVLTYTNTGLTNGTTYYYKVAAKNSAGIGSQSTETNATVFNTPSAPQNLSATPSSQQIQLNWSAPSSNGGSAITNYEIYRSTTSGQETLLIEVGNVLTYTNTSLTNGTTYYYKIAAKNGVGIGTQTGEISAIPQSAPSAPQSVTARYANSRISLVWSAPSSNGGSAITNYKVYRGATSGSETLLATVGNVFSYADTGLNNGTTYYYKVSAVNGVGESSLSAETSAAPQNVFLFFLSSNTYSADLGGLDGADSKCQASADAAALGGTWKAWLSGNTISASSRLSHETVPYKLVNGGTIANNWTDLTDGSLAACPNVTELSTSITNYDNSYSFVGVYTNTTTSGLSGGSGYSCGDWTYNGGFPTMKMGNAYDGFWCGSSPSNVPWTDIGSSYGGPYHCSYHEDISNNYAGRIYCIEQGSNTLPSAPLNLTATGGDAQIQLNWSAPSSSGGSSITNYEIYRSTSSGQETFLTEVGNVLTYTNTGLTNGTTYYYKVAAKNSVGIGPQSTETNGVPITIPSAPQTLSATAGNAQIQLNWSAPTSNGGSAITNYKIYRSTTSGQETFLIQVGNVLTYTNTGLTNGTTYYYKISAVNSVGEGSQSNEDDAMPVAAPSVPQNLSVSVSTSTQLVLSWQAPASNNGSAITNYKIYRGTGSGGEGYLTTIGNVLTYTDSSLTNGTGYYYKISAVNSVGEGSQSDEMNATAALGTCSGCKYIFVSSAWYSPSNLGTTGGGLDGGDSTCQTIANAVGGTGSYKAWLSSSVTDASSRTTHSSLPYLTTNGTTTIATNWSDLTDGSLAHGIDRSEYGNLTTGYYGRIYTNTSANGARASSNPVYTCQDWTVGGYDNYAGYLGTIGDTSSTWTVGNLSTMECGHPSQAGGLYCVEQ